MMRRLWQLLKDDSGAALAEYGLIAAIVGAAIAVGSLALGSAVTSAIQDDACNAQQTC
jgi:pilus assembly protein Flp/PilA